MSYRKVLASKWRPQTFAEIVGQEHVLMALKNGLSLGRIHHAYLFSGTRGVGKTSIARLLAKSLNCKIGITANPCCKCNNCQEIEKGCFFDLIEVDAASRSKVEDIRELLDNVQYAAIRGNYKIYLIDEVHMLSRHSFNAILKTLEEPPAHIKFLLATTDPQKIPVTVLSRCLQFHLKVLSFKEIYNQLSKILQQEKINAAPEALKMLAQAANGSMRDALSLTDQAIAIGNGMISIDATSLMLGSLNAEYPLAIIESLVDSDANAMIAHCARCADYYINWDSLLLDIISLLYRLTLGKVSPERLNEDEENPNIFLRLQKLMHRLLPVDLQFYYHILLIGRKELPFAPNPRIAVEMVLLRALTFHTKETKMKLSADSNNTFIFNNEFDNASKTNFFNKFTVNNFIRSKEKLNFYKNKRVVSSITFEEKNRLKSKLSDMSINKDSSTSDLTTQIIQARNSIILHQKTKKNKENKPTTTSIIDNNINVNKTTLESTKSNEKIKQYSSFTKKINPIKKQCFSSTFFPLNQNSDSKTTLLNIPNNFKNFLEHEKKSKIETLIEDKLIKVDPWAAQIYRLKIPKLVQQLALNTWKENLEPNNICLHLRSSQNHLNSKKAQHILCKAICTDLGNQITLTIIEDNDVMRQTPIEKQQAFYKEKLIQKKKIIINDPYIQKLKLFFDAELDENSIQYI